MFLIKLAFNSLFVLFFTVPIMLLILTLDETATIAPNPGLSPSQISEVQQLLIDHDPRLLLNSNNQVVRLTESELNTLVNYTRNNLPELEETALLATLADGAARLDISFPVNMGPFGHFVNAAVTLVPHERKVQINAIEIGKLQLPSWLYRDTLNWFISFIEDNQNYLLFRTLVDSVNYVLIEDKALELGFNWEMSDIEQIRTQAQTVFISPREQERLVAYQQRLIELTADLAGSPVPERFHSLLQGLFTTARANSQIGGDPVAENRAVLIVLTAYLTDIELAYLTGEQAMTGLSKPTPLNIRIENRVDLAQHLVGSAAIAASSDVSVADILSVYKEVHDSRYRTGFSFSDLTANEAGARLGELASASRDSALLFQNLILAADSTAHYMPVTGAIDGLTEAEFTEQYQNRNSPEYLARLAEIRNTISLLPFFQEFATQQEPAL